jgi:hypothetical protein
MGQLDAAPGKPCGNAADFLDRPADQRWRGFVFMVLRIVFGGGARLA